MLSTVDKAMARKGVSRVTLINTTISVVCSHNGRPDESPAFFFPHATFRCRSLDSRLMPHFTTVSGDMWCELWIQQLHAIGTDRVRKFRLRMFTHKRLQLLPVAVVVANFFARGANGQQAAQCFDLRERLVQMRDQIGPFGFNPLALGD